MLKHRIASKVLNLLYPNNEEDGSSALYRAPDIAPDASPDGAAALCNAPDNAADGPTELCNAPNNASDGAAVLCNGKIMLQTVQHRYEVLHMAQQMAQLHHNVLQIMLQTVQLQYVRGGG